MHQGKVNVNIGKLVSDIWKLQNGKNVYESANYRSKERIMALETDNHQLINQRVLLKINLNHHKKKYIHSKFSKVMEFLCIFPYKRSII